MHSMTGFGRGSASSVHCAASVEIASVNRKQAEVVIRAGRDLAELENRIRKQVLDRVSRGRIQVTIELDRPSGDLPPIDVNLPLAAAMDAAFKQISARLGREVIPEAADFIRAPGILNFDESGMDAEDAWHAIEPALAEAMAQFLEMRAAEGADLAQDLRNRLAILEGLRLSIAELAPARPERYREALFKRLREAGLDLNLDDERVVREIGLFADRCDVSEEITRLDAHLARFRDYLAGSEPAGRPLDFLCQEIHREFNTIGSKASDAAIAQHVVSAKTELEKIREQVQNIE